MNWIKKGTVLTPAVDRKNQKLAEILWEKCQQQEQILMSQFGAIYAGHSFCATVLVEQGFPVLKFMVLKTGEECWLKKWPNQAK